jgi:Protein of unknown function (DUF3551)
MRAWIVLIVVAAASLTGGCGSARPSPYCAWTPAYNSCNYLTLEACRANITGTDQGVCGPNPAYKEPPSK